MFRGIKSPVVRSWYSRSSFKPTHLTGCVLWLHAEDYNASTGAWTDRSGNGNNGSQGTAGARPAVGTGVNGRATVNFDGTADHIEVDSVASSFSGTGKAQTLVALINNPSSTGDVALWSVGIAGAAFPEKVCWIASTDEMKVRYEDDLDVETIHTGNGRTEATDLTVAWRDTGTAIDTAIGTTWATETAFTAKPCTDLAISTVGSFKRNGLETLFWKGHIRELALYAAALSDANVTNVMNGMRKRAGMAAI